MNGESTPRSIWIRAYTTDGYQISLTLPALTVSDAMRHRDDVRAVLRGRGRLMYRATFEPEWRRRWLELKKMTRGDGE
jgi:hypothetical protein